MKHRIYPWLIGAGTLTLFAGYFFFYFASILVTFDSRPAFGWNTDVAFVIFVSAVWSAAVIAGLFIALMAALFFGHISKEEIRKPQSEPLTLKQAA